MDREKVIKAVEEAFDLVHSDFIGTDDFNETEWEQNKANALSLLKEQEHKDKMYRALEDDWKRLKKLLKEHDTANIYKCPNCRTWVSAENVVRCKDCKYGDWTQNMLKEDMIFCYNGDTGIEDGYLHEPNWFCAEGERRTD